MEMKDLLEKVRNCISEERYLLLQYHYGLIDGIEYTFWEISDLLQKSKSDVEESIKTSLEMIREALEQQVDNSYTR